MTRRTGRARGLVAFLALSIVGPASAGELSISVYQPGGGFLVTDSKLRVPIEVIVRGDNGPIPLERATVTPGAGKAHDVEIVGQGRVLFYYQPPDKLRTGSDIGELRIERPGGSAGVFTLTLRVAQPAAPKLSLDVSPSRFNVLEPPSAIQIAASALGATELIVVPSAGAVGGDLPERSGDGVELTTRYTLPSDLPNDAPSHISFVGVAAGPTGWAAKSAGVSVLSKLRVSLAIEPGHQLVLEGSENKPAPVTAAADGKTVVEDVVRYGAPVRAFQIRAGKKKELSVAIPSGLVPIATVAPIPGQAIADGGTGPSLIITVPPGPFGGEALWPELEVQGAELVSTINLSAYARALVLKRPRRVENVTILGDGVPVATIPFIAGLGESLAVQTDTAQPNERAAAKIRVLDAFGNRTDQPTPRAKLGTGEELPITRTGLGEYRVSVPPSVGGDTGTRATITVLLTPPRPIDDEPVELLSADTPVRLESGGAGAPIRSDEPIVPDAPRVVEDGWRVGLMASGVFGTTFNGELLVGGAALLELRPPIWGARLSLRTGLELYRASGSGSLILSGDASAPTTVLYAGFVIPVLVGASLRPTESLEITGRVGLELRSETGVLDAGSDRVGGGSRFGPAFRMGAEVALELGPGALCGSVDLGGFGASASGLNGPTVSFEGALTHVRLDLGYRVWF